MGRKGRHEESWRCEIYGIGFVSIIAIIVGVVALIAALNNGPHWSLSTNGADLVESLSAMRSTLVVVAEGQVRSESAMGHKAPVCAEGNLDDQAECLCKACESDSGISTCSRKLEWACNIPKLGEDTA